MAVCKWHGTWQKQIRPWQGWVSQVLPSLWSIRDKEPIPFPAFCPKRKERFISLREHPFQDSQGSWSLQSSGLRSWKNSSPDDWQRKGEGLHPATLSWQSLSSQWEPPALSLPPSFPPFLSMKIVFVSVTHVTCFGPGVVSEVLRRSLFFLQPQPY